MIVNQIDEMHWLESTVYFRCLCCQLNFSHILNVVQKLKVNDLQPHIRGFYNQSVCEEKCFLLSQIP